MAKNAEKVEETQSEIGVLEAERRWPTPSFSKQARDGQHDQAFCILSSLMMKPCCMRWCGVDAAGPTCVVKTCM